MRDLKELFCVLKLRERGQFCLADGRMLLLSFLLLSPPFCSGKMRLALVVRPLSSLSFFPFDGWQKMWERGEGGQLCKSQVCALKRKEG